LSTERFGTSRVLDFLLIQTNHSDWDIEHDMKIIAWTRYASDCASTITIVKVGTRSALFSHSALLQQAVVGSMRSLNYEPKVLYCVRSCVSHFYPQSLYGRLYLRPRLVLSCHYLCLEDIICNGTCRIAKFQDTCTCCVENHYIEGLGQFWTQQMTMGWMWLNLHNERMP
jgi:hypothetical protein